METLEELGRDSVRRVGAVLELEKDQEWFERSSSSSRSGSGSGSGSCVFGGDGSKGYGVMMREDLRCENGVEVKSKVCLFVCLFRSGIF